MSPDPLSSARALLPAQQIRAAGVFGVQDHTLATGLLGAEWVAAATTALVRPDPSMAPYLPWMAVPVAVAVSQASIHILNWHPDLGATAELARFPREVTAVSVETAGTGRRLTLTDTRTGYRLPLTATVSRLHPYSTGSRAVLQDLAPASGPLAQLGA